MWKIHWIFALFIFCTWSLIHTAPLLIQTMDTSNHANERETAAHLEGTHWMKIKKGISRRSRACDCTNPNVQISVLQVQPRSVFWSVFASCLLSRRRHKLTGPSPRPPRRLQIVLVHSREAHRFRKGRISFPRTGCVQKEFESVLNHSGVCIGGRPELRCGGLRWSMCWLTKRQAGTQERWEVTR